MKNSIALLIALFISIASFSQNGINYKAIIKDDLGNIISNSNINVQIAIEIFALPIYVETHNVNTNANGLIILNIGEGTVVEGDFEDIDWKNDRPDLHVQVDIGNGYVDLGSTSFKMVPYALRALQVDGLEEVREGGNLGLRLFGVDPDKYGDIGENAIDLSYSNNDFDPNPINFHGAIGSYSVAMGRYTAAAGAYSKASGIYSRALGDYSTAMGYNTLASGEYSTATGLSTEAIGDQSTAMGYESNASGENSMAMGFSTNASGTVSTAMGVDTEASGHSSTALGFNTEASGDSSTAMGLNTQANAYCTTALGRFNNGGGNATSWNNFDPLFVIGNGTSDSDRNNALTVLKNGSHTMRSSSTGLSIYAENSGIVSISENGYGADLYGADAGLRTRATEPQNPDLILRGNSSDNSEDDGIISTDPNYSGSDLYLRSYGGIIAQLDYDDSGSGNFNVRNAENVDVLSVTETGNVSIAGRLEIGNERIEDTGGNQLSIDASVIPNGDNNFRLGNSSNRWISVYAADGTINTSDKRSKTNIASLNYGLKDIMKLNPVSFNWKTNPNDDTKLGLIAQDLLKVIPEVVKTHDWETDENGDKIKKELARMGVYYSDLVPVLIKAIQEQQNIIDAQNSNYSSLLERIEALEAHTSN